MVATGSVIRNAIFAAVMGTLIISSAYFWSSQTGSHAVIPGAGYTTAQSSPPTKPVQGGSGSPALSTLAHSLHPTAKLTETHGKADETSVAALAGTKASNRPQLQDILRHAKIALVSPTFTAAAYDNSFYRFFMLHRQAQPNSNVTATGQLRLLTARVKPSDASSALSRMLYLARELGQTMQFSTAKVLTDADVDGDMIFQKNGSNAFDLIILGHQEYVTQQEYSNLKKFVSDGGTLVLLDGNVFYAQVRYDNVSKSVTLVKGHGWAYNGHSAWRSIGERWANETREWAGSNYLCYSCSIRFANNPFGYRHHEEQYITNPRDVILYKYQTSDKHHVIATYELDYMKGRVIGLGIYADDIAHSPSFDRYFSFLILHYAIP